MKYAVISDIHANLEALTSVVQHIDAQDVDRIVCLGDLVGYHAEPNEVIQIIRDRDIQCIAGNHDTVATGAKEPVRFGETGKRAIYWTRGRLTSESKEFLESLPLTATIDEGGFMMVHASLNPVPNEDIYLRSEADAAANFGRLAALAPQVGVCFFGHTHWPTVFEFSRGRVDALDPTTVQLMSAASYLINPGSVGRPPNRDPRASFLIFDSGRQEVQFHRVRFDVEACCSKARKVGLLHQESLLSLAENVAQGWLDAGGQPRKWIRKAISQRG
jgi:predicted phosphodiesterase